MEPNVAQVGLQVLALFLSRSMLLAAVSAAFLLFGFSYVLARRVRKNLYAVVTGIDDIPYLGQALEKLDGTAVICGGR